MHRNQSKVSCKKISVTKLLQLIVFLSAFGFADLEFNVKKYPICTKG